VKQGEVVEMFVRGKQQPVKLLSFDVYDQPESRYRGEVADLYLEGLEALQDGDAEEAEACFRDALALSPRAPDLTQNLAAALEQQGRRDEAFGLLEELHRREPEYLFARCGVAQLTALRGNADEADRLLVPMHQVTRLHVSELASYARARAAIAKARGNRPLAAYWDQLAAERRLGTVFQASPVAP
jgi:tetratricopeptide (TPR) repeat protein